MADLTVTPARLREGEAVLGRREPRVADESISRGQLVYLKSNGRVAKARANAIGTAKTVGFATSDANAGDTVEALWQGKLFGFDLSSVNPGTTLYLSTATAGAVQDTKPTGTGNVVFPVGSVQVMTDVAQTRYLAVDISLSADPVALP